jgi:hypothetical protein
VVPANPVSVVVLLLNENRATETSFSTNIWTPHWFTVGGVRGDQ